MFNLEQAITEWRGQLLAAGIKAPKTLEELESHLREETERQIKSGLEWQRAFEVAAQQVGEASVLKSEFTKLTGESSIMEKIRLGICVIFVGFILWLSTYTIFCCYQNWADRVTALAAVAGILLVACAWRRALPFIPVLQNARTRLMAGLVCIASGFAASSIFLQVIASRFDKSPDHQLPAIGFWAVFLIASFACVGVGLTMSKQEREVFGEAKFFREESAATNP